MIVHKPDGTAVVAGTRLPVWAVVALFDRGQTMYRIMRHFPCLSLDGWQAAWRYYRDHEDEIDAAITS